MLRRIGYLMMFVSILVLGAGIYMIEVNFCPISVNGEEEIVLSINEIYENEKKEDPSQRTNILFETNQVLSKSECFEAGMGGQFYGPCFNRVAERQIMQWLKSQPGEKPNKPPSDLPNPPK